MLEVKKQYFSERKFPILRVFGHATRRFGAYYAMHNFKVVPRENKEVTERSSTKILNFTKQFN